MPLPFQSTICLAAIAAICLTRFSAAAQTNDAALPEIGNDFEWADSTDGNWKLALSSSYTAIAGGGVDFPGAHGNSSAESAEASLNSAATINDSWFVPVDLTLRNYFLSSIPRAPIPNQIYTVALNAGLGYHLNDQWTIGATVGPRLYRLDSVDGSGLGIGHCLWAAFQWKSNIKFAVAVAVDPNRDVPILPAGGLRWEIQTNLTLKLMFPKSGLDYQFNNRLSLRASFVANYAVFRADDNLGAKIDMPQYNDGLGTYRDFLAGIGAEYKIARCFSAAFKAGYSFDRQLDYQRIGGDVKFDSSPFVQFGLKYHF
jgi:Domain of unknown function (DUF6268)